jgi:hypothetical protein
VLSLDFPGHGRAATWGFVVTGTSSKGCSNMLAYLLP